MYEASDIWTSTEEVNVNIPSNEMIEICQADVPQYLQDGEFFRNLHNDDEEDLEKFWVPGNCLKPSIIVANYSDLRFLLRSLRYWMVADVPWTAEFFLFESSCLFEIDEFLDYLPKPLMTYIINKTSMREVMLQALKRGSLPLLLWLRKEHYTLPSNACYLAALSGKLNVLEFTYNIIMTLDQSCVRAAIISGSLECLQYIHQHGESRTSYECNI